MHAQLLNLNIERSLNDKLRSSVSLQKDAFDGSRKDINAAIDRICEFTGKHFLLEILGMKVL